jgi:hypothetical protein
MYVKSDWIHGKNALRLDRTSVKIMTAIVWPIATRDWPLAVEAKATPGNVNQIEIKQFNRNSSRVFAYVVF